VYAVNRASSRCSKTFVMLQLSRVARFVIESGPRVYRRLYRDIFACHWVITFYAMSDIPSTHDLCVGHRDRKEEREIERGRERERKRERGEKSR